MEGVMNTTRRKLLSTAALGPVLFATGGAAGGALVSCQGGQIVVDPAVLQAIQAAVATTCNFIPSVITIVALVAASFPAAAGVTTIATSVLNEISAILCASAPKASSLAAATAPNTNVAVHGWIIGSDGKLVYV